LLLFDADLSKKQRLADGRAVVLDSECGSCELCKDQISNNEDLYPTLPALESRVCGKANTPPKTHQTSLLVPKEIM
jgi:hypothetical protein